MAEIVEGSVETPETPVVETPQAETKPAQKEVEYTAIELQAMEQGWKPLAEWDGDPSEHRSAREYVDRGELLSKIKTQGVQIRESQQMLTHLAEHNRRTYQAGYERALAELKAQRAAAMKDGDIDTALALEERIDQHKDAIADIKRQPAAPQQQTVSPVYADWLRKNEWYSTDDVMRHTANGLAVKLGKEKPGVTEEEVYDYLHKKMREEFPHKFKKSVVSPPGPDGSGRAPASAKSAGGKSGDAFEALLATFDEHAAKAARNLVKQGYLTKEKYVEDYNNS